ncbi:hypothetical protein P8452_51309 [Trifolium repens]|nr:hypothetical protein P8452_51309 [Trifolium repens]
MQNKNNVQSRDTLVSNGNRKYMKQKEQTETKSNQFTRNQKPITNRALPQKTSANCNSNVLVQNNPKKNSMTSKCALRNSLYDRLSKATSGKARVQITLKLRTSTELWELMLSYKYCWFMDPNISGFKSI